MTDQHTYPLSQCLLYKVTSPAQLATRLMVPLVDLEAFANSTNNYLIRQKQKPSGEFRTIQEPKKPLQAIHARIHKLLSRVNLPGYVHSVRKGRSYITNAHAHTHDGGMIKLDIERFFQSVRSGAIFAFWRGTMQCRADVAGLLTKLVTYNGHLPTGSSSSPILSFFAYQPMFDEIAEIALRKNLTPTLYVDDMVISGPGADSGILTAAKQIVSKHGLRSHKYRHFGGRRPRIVTGVMVTSSGVALPHRRSLKIKEGYTALHAAAGPAEKLKILEKLGSLVHEAAQIEPRNRPKAVELDTLRRQLKRSLRQRLNVNLSKPTTQPAE